MAIQALKDKKGEKIIGYKGYSHRVGMEFKVGDIMFDGKWEMPKTHRDYEKYKKKAKGESIEEHVPYRLRGNKICKTLADCKKAAENFGNYVS